MTNPPFGLYGGLPGDGGALYRENADGTKLVVSALSYFRVSEGELWCAIATGGGGYGDPLERDPAKVAADTRDEFISQEMATDIYGVVFGAGDFAIDLAATEQRRAKLRGDRTIVEIDPSVPGAATYYRSLVGPNDVYALNPRPPEDADATL